MKRVLVLGASGMAGHVIATYLDEAGYEVDTLSSKVPLDKNTTIVDVRNLEDVREVLDSNNYDVVINCIAILVNESEDRKDLASYINSFFPLFLEGYYKGKKTKVIHLSTDAVFSDSSSPFSEKTPYGGTGFYGRSKALGEINNDKDLTIRMSIIGPKLKLGGGLFDYVFTSSGAIRGYDKAIWNGVTTVELAKGVKGAIEQDISGVYHFAPEESISKYRLLKLLAKEFRISGVEIEGDSSQKYEREFINTRTDFNYTVVNYERMVSEMGEWVESHEGLYPHYIKRMNKAV